MCLPDRQTPDKVILMCRFAFHATEKVKWQHNATKNFDYTTIVLISIFQTINGLYKIIPNIGLSYV